MKQSLRLFVNERQDDWDELLPLAEFNHNNRIHSSTQQSPFMLDTGRDPRMGFEPDQPRSHLESVNEFKDKMAQGLEESNSAQRKMQDESALYYNRRRDPAPEFKPGDRVWLDASDIHTTRPSAKLSHRRLGPFPVVARVGYGAYKLKLSRSLSRLHNVFSVTKLSLALPDPIPGRRTAPPPEPVLVDGLEEFEVEKILDSRMRYNRLEYLVKWKGYDTGHNGWEPHYHLHAPDEVAQFHRDFPNAPRPIGPAAFDSISFIRRDDVSENGGVNVRGHYNRGPILLRSSPTLFRLSRLI
jgi:hypothetical protein